MAWRRMEPVLWVAALVPLCAACGGSNANMTAPDLAVPATDLASPPVGDRDAGSGDAGDAGGGAGDAATGADAGGGAIVWQLVGNLDRWPGNDATDRVLVDTDIFAPMYGQRWSITTAARNTAPFMSGTNLTLRQSGCSCMVGTHSYILGGGGDGVTSAWSEYTFLDADFDQRALSSHAAPFTAHGVACAAAGGHCYVVGGTAGQGGTEGTAAVRVFSPANASFAAGPPLPVPTALAATASGLGKLLVAGGYCTGGAPCPPKNDPSGQPAAVLSSVYILDLANPTWQPAASLPRPVARAGMVFLSGRFYLVGGAASAYGPINPSGVLSFAPGETAWQSHGGTPGTGPVVAVFTDGKSIFVVIAEANFEYHLYRGTF